MTTRPNPHRQRQGHEASMSSPGGGVNPFVGVAVAHSVFDLVIAGSSCGRFPRVTALTVRR